MVARFGLADAALDRIFHALADDAARAARCSGSTRRVSPR
jgi:hypothetical protein